MLDTTKQEREKSEVHNLRMQLSIKVKAWSDRMLAALVNGVKGNKWFSLIDKINSKDTLYAAWELVEKNNGSAGVDRVTTEKFAAQHHRYLNELHEKVKESKYVPLLIKRAYIPKGEGKTRPLGIPSVIDRVMQCAIKLVIEPIFEYEFVETSYGFRPGRGCKDALRHVQNNLDEGYVHVVDADLQSYFDTIPHDKLMNRIRDKISDGRLLEIIFGFLKQGILEDCKEWIPTEGTPQGAVLSPLLANIYLHPLDVLMLNHGIRMVRYADDFVIMCKSKEDASKALTLVKKWIEENSLILHPDKTSIGDCRIPGQGFEFLGYKFENGERQVRKKSLNKFKDKIRSLTKRNNGYNVQQIVASLNPILKGWFGYFKHAHKWTFERIDKWIRRRLRAILKRRKKGDGMGKTLKDHIEWPNRYFAEIGLFSLQEAYNKAICAMKAMQASQSRCGNH